MNNFCFTHLPFFKSFFCQISVVTPHWNNPAVSATDNLDSGREELGEKGLLNKQSKAGEHSPITMVGNKRLPWANLGLIVNRGEEGGGRFNPCLLKK